jgi:dihydroorotate dehydrogenase
LRIETVGQAAWWARLEGVFRPWLVRLPAPLAVAVYSTGRRHFLHRLVASPPSPEAGWSPPESLARTLWGLRFRTPVGNGAGMFKNGEGFALAAGQGAGWYLAGTTTGQPWRGNRWGARWAGSLLGVAQPFAPYPRSAAASNWLGLPNDGTVVVAARLAHRLQGDRVPNMPVGASVAATPGLGEDAALTELVAGMETYAEAGVDFLEINESCPNTEEGRPGDSALARRLEVVGERFLRRRSRSLPVVVKLSCDTAVEQIPELLTLLLDSGFDGVNFGNTSRDYPALRGAILPPEQRLFDFFTAHFGGGVSGRPLRQRSLDLVRASAADLAGRRLPREFHILRTGGIDSAEDVAAAQAAGASLCGWYTGYFEAFARHGHGVYQHLLEETESF